MSAYELASIITGELITELTNELTGILVDKSVRNEVLDKVELINRTSIEITYKGINATCLLIKISL